MLGLSRWTSFGGSYRTIQRFFNTPFNWPSIRWLLVRDNLQNENDTVVIAADEVTVTKSGKKTYGIGRFFSSLYGKKVSSLCFQSLSLVSVKNRRSSPIMMEQVMPDVIKSSSALTKSIPNTKKAKNTSPGRPLGSKNKNRKEIELSPYVQNTLNSLLTLVNTDISLVYFFFDGAFGNNDALQMVRQCQLHLISKMRHDSALYLPYVGKYSGRGLCQKYGKKLNCRAIAKKYLKSTSVDGNIRTDISQCNVWHKLFADRLNVVIIKKTHLKTGKAAHVIL